MNKKAWGEANHIFCSLSQEIFLRKERARRRREQGFEVISFPEKEKEREGEFCRFQRHKNQGRIILLFQQFQQGKQDVFQGRICSFDGRFFQHVFRDDFCRFLKERKKFAKKNLCSYSPYIHTESVQSVRNWPYGMFFEADCVQNFCWAVFLARGSRRINSEISAGHSGIDWHVYQGIW